MGGPTTPSNRVGNVRSGGDTIEVSSAHPGTAHGVWTLCLPRSVAPQGSLGRGGTRVYLTQHGIIPTNPPSDSRGRPPSAPKAQDLKHKTRQSRSSPFKS